MTGRIQFTVKHRKQFDDDLVLTNNRKGREGRISYIGSRAPSPHIPITRVRRSATSHVIRPGLDDAILKMVREKVGAARERGRFKLTKIQVAISARAPWLTLNGCVIIASACMLGKITAYCGLTPSRRIIPVAPRLSIMPFAMKVYRVFRIVTFFLFRLILFYCLN